jgi:hypothetical protein
VGGLEDAGGCWEGDTIWRIWVRTDGREPRWPEISLSGIEAFWIELSFAPRASPGRRFVKLDPERGGGTFGVTPLVAERDSDMGDET